MSVSIKTDCQRYLHRYGGRRGVVLTFSCAMDRLSGADWNPHGYADNNFQDTRNSRPSVHHIDFDLRELRQER
jgi:hypothetical protein